MVKRVPFLSALAFLVCASTATWHASGQTPPPKTATPGAKPAAMAKAPAEMSKMPLIQVQIFQIKSDKMSDFIAMEKDEIVPALQKGGVKQRTAVATVFGPGGEVVFLTPLDQRLTGFDGQNPFVRALGQDGANALLTKARAMIASGRTLVVRARTDLSYMPEPDAKLPIAVVSDYSVAPGRGADFEAYLRDDLQAVHKQARTSGFMVYQPLFGGAAGGFVVASLIHDFAELDKGPAAIRALGVTGAAKLQQKLAGIVTHVERTVSREIPELTFSVKASTER